MFCLARCSSQNWGMHPDPRRRSRHSRGERDVLAGGAGQNMIPFSFPACGRGNSARLALPGEGRWTERLVGPFGFLRAAARTCWVCPAGRVRWTVGAVRPCGVCGLPPGPACPAGRVRWTVGCVGTYGFLRAAARTCCFSGPGNGTERGMDTLKEATHAQSQPR